jgi:triosephosphate isomerase
MRTPIMGGNWKMHTRLEEAVQLAGDVRRLVAQVRDVDIVIFPPFPLLTEIGKKLEDSRVQLGAQHCHAEEKGAFTGAVSTGMLASVGCSHVLVGHSERRHVFGDDDVAVNARLHAVVAEGMVPVFCIGETQTERRAGQTNERISRQLEDGLRGIDAEQMVSMVMAYEPVWAIGTGDTATPGQAQDVHAFIREWIDHQYGESVANAVRIQYGGSVKPDNVDALMGCPDIDGALVGGASLKPESFVRIVKFER